MVKYTAKRLLQSLITVLVVATIVFLLMRMLPTDYYFTEDQVMKLTEEQKNAQLEAAGLLDPMEQQLGRFYGQLLRLDFGTSRRIQNGAPVLKVIGTKFSVSMRLGCIALVIALLIGVTMGIIQSRNKDRDAGSCGNGVHGFCKCCSAAGILLAGAGLWRQFAEPSGAVFHQKCHPLQHPSDRMPCVNLHCPLCAVDQTIYGRRAE